MFPFIFSWLYNFSRNSLVQNSLDLEKFLTTTFGSSRNPLKIHQQQREKKGVGVLLLLGTLLLFLSLLSFFLSPGSSKQHKNWSGFFFSFTWNGSESARGSRPLYLDRLRTTERVQGRIKREREKIKVSRRRRRKKVNSRRTDTLILSLSLSLLVSTTESIFLLLRFFPPS